MQVDSRPTARIPIVVFKDSKSGLECDISVMNPLAVRNTRLLKVMTKQGDEQRYSIGRPLRTSNRMLSTARLQALLYLVCIFISTVSRCMYQHVLVCILYMMFAVCWVDEEGLRVQQDNTHTENTLSAA